MLTARTAAASATAKIASATSTSISVKPRAQCPGARLPHCDGLPGAVIVVSPNVLDGGRIHTVGGHAEAIFAEGEGDAKRVMDAGAREQDHRLGAGIAHRELDRGEADSHG